MASFRFCRTDDVDLLVRAIHVGYAPYFMDEQMITSEDFKREIKEVNIWTSSCMVATEGKDPFGVLVVAKRDNCSLVTRLGIHKDYRGHKYASQMLISLRDKMAILGPPDLAVELPVERKDLIQFFQSVGFAGEGQEMFCDYVLGVTPDSRGLEAAIIEMDGDGLEEMGGRFLTAGLQESDLAWFRQSRTLISSPETIRGIGIAGMEGADAYLFYTKGRNLPSHGLRATPYPDNVIEIVAMGSRAPEKANVYFRNLITTASDELGAGRFIIPKLALGEVPSGIFESIGFEKAGAYTRLVLKCGEGRVAPGARE